MKAPGAWLVALAALGSGACGSAEDPSGPTPTPTPADCVAVPGTPPLTSERVATGFNRPLDVQAAPGDRERLFVVEQGGSIRIVRGGQVLAPPFLDIAARISSGGELGLLGLAFHPRYAENRRFFVNYTNRQGDTHIAEFRASTADPNRADPDSERVLLVQNQPFANHNAGGLAFGRDGMLHFGLGDGGGGGDPLRAGQNLGTLLGKMLRIDVDGATPYAIPADNPFRATQGARPEIWAYGLRNPFRFSVDRTTGDLYIGDVGQNAYEEISVGLAARRGGENYGWSIMEGFHCFRPASGCDMTGLTLPVVEYDHGDGCSVTGGYVYRGCRMPGYAGTYFYGDFCTGLIRSFRLEAGRAVDQRDWTAAIGRGVIQSISSFGVDADGELYVVDYGGSIHRVVPASQ